MLAFYQDVHSTISTVDVTNTNAFETIIEKVKLLILALVYETYEYNRLSSLLPSPLPRDSNAGDSDDDDDNDDCNRTTTTRYDKSCTMPSLGMNNDTMINQMYNSVTIYDMLDPNDAHLCRQVLLSCIEKSNAKCQTTSSFYYFLTNCVGSGNDGGSVNIPSSPPSRQTLLKSR